MRFVLFIETCWLPWAKLWSRHVKFSQLACHTNIPYTIDRGLKQRKWIFSSFWRLGSPRSRCWQIHCLVRRPSLFIYGCQWTHGELCPPRWKGHFSWSLTAAFENFAESPPPTFLVWEHLLILSQWNGWCGHSCCARLQWHKCTETPLWIITGISGRKPMGNNTKKRMRK